MAAQLYKYWNIGNDFRIWIMGQFSGCSINQAMDLAKMWHLMKAHRKRTKITKVIPTWPSPQLAPTSTNPATTLDTTPVISSLAETSSLSETGHSLEEEEGMADYTD